MTSSEVLLRSAPERQRKNPFFQKEEICERDVIIPHEEFDSTRQKQKVPKTKSHNNSKLKPEKKISSSESPEFDYEKIGLKGDIKDFLPQCPDNLFIDHETDFECIKDTLLQRLEQSDSDLTTKQSLEVIGFTSDKAAELENNIFEEKTDEYDSQGEFYFTSQKQRVPKTKSHNNSQLEPEKKISRSENPEFDYGKIGLKGDIKDYLPQCPDNSFIDHETDFEYIKDTLLQRLEQSDPDLNSKMLLETIGFTSGKASELGNYFNENDHDSLACLVELYLEHCFHRFPSDLIEDSAPKNTWFTVDQSGNIFTEGTDGYNSKGIQHINVGDEESLQLLIKDNNAKFPLSGESDRLWYHGTISASVSGIKKRINLGKGGSNRDFSDQDGFYLTHSFNDASDRAKIKNKFGIHCATLIFENTLNPERYHGKDLSQDEGTEWEQVVNYYKNEQDVNGTLQKELDAADYIFGAVSRNKKKNPNYVPKKNDLCYVPEKTSMQQLCIKSKKMAVEFRKNLKGVIFFQTNAK